MHTAQSMLRRFLGSTQAGPQLSIFRKMKRKLPAPLRAGAGRIGRLLGTAYRAVLLRRVTFIGVTGSVGKTTTKEIISAILARQFTGSKSEGNDNVLMYNTTFRVRPWHKYCVQEIAAAVGSQKIPLERSLALVSPGIGVVTSIGTDHLSVFGSMEAIAAEKGKLIEALPDTGAAILNADDPLVLAMSLRCRGKIVTYGLAADAQVRAEGIRSSWPDRLTFDVIHGDQRHTVRTQLCGTHWVPCVLAAIATSLEMGVPLAAAAHAIETVPPAKRRMEPVIRADGITFIRDDIKAPLQSIPPALDFIRNAQASRRIVVIGTISDYAGNSTRRYNQVARQALDVADLVLFVGPKASKCLKSKNHPKGEALLMFNSAALAAEYLSDILNPGDLVLLKGSEHADNLEAILSAQRRDRQSLELDGLGALPRERATPLHVTWSRPAEQRRVATRVAEPGSVRLVAGLGNPGEKYRDTPHNVGHRVLDRLASTLEGSWEPRGETAVASVEWKGTRVYLTKLVTNVNNSGPVLERLCRELAFGPADCVLVHDDVDLPLGTVRVRMRGSDGGHRGVRSVFEVFGTDSIARVKVGVGRPGRSSEVASHVLRPFLLEELAAVEASLDRAVAGVLELLPADDVGLCRSQDAGPLWPPGLPEQSENLERTASR